ncbi:hypothetical protein K2173_012164 [Erythroxylum novogranatense]|uniref:Uncharacterized protein n=1 Tax=Erythroxylum novogranatense TaxID=1862640 RepID=A0AAV8SRY5_9ROSI|nr:hypothetical protein K2173_012164 [Erythroxylum novogranatense]
MEEPEDVNEEMRIHKASPFDIKTKQDAEKVAVELLATRAFTSVELRKKLCAKKFPPHLMEALSAIVQVDVTPFKQWYLQHYKVDIGSKKKTTSPTKKEGEVKDQDSVILNFELLKELVVYLGQ